MEAVAKCTRSFLSVTNHWIDNFAFFTLLDYKLLYFCGFRGCNSLYSVTVLRSDDFCGIAYLSSAILMSPYILWAL